MIHVDTREQHWEQIAEYLLEFGADFVVDTQYHKADYVIDAADGDRFGIQRKSMNDFTGSLDTLKDDLAELRDYYDMSALLIEGDWKIAGKAIGLRRGRVIKKTIAISTLHNMLLSQQLRGTMLIRTSCLEETCRVLSDYDLYLDGPMSPPRTVIDDPCTLLMDLPGIGPETAQNIVDAYSDPYEAIMDMDRWDETVDGIGEVTKSNITDWLREQ